jgi:hypothetical protein
VGPLPANASVEEQIERLHKQLDGMHAVKKPILGSYEVLSHSNRRQGGMLLTLRVLRFSLSSSGCPVGATMCLKMLILPYILLPSTVLVLSLCCCCGTADNQAESLCAALHGSVVHF